MMSTKGEKLQPPLKSDTAFGIGGSVSTSIYIAEQFQLTKEIVLPHVKIAVSDNVNVSVLGMDILDLFSFKYDIGIGNMLGTFFIFNYQKQLKKIETLCKNNNTLGINMIMLMDDGTSTQHKARHKDNQQAVTKFQGTINIVGIIVDAKGMTIGYKLQHKYGKVIDVEKSRVIAEAQKGNIDNATVVKLGNEQFILRGKGCKLSNLPKYRA